MAAAREDGPIGLCTLAVANYRSLHDLVLPLQPLTLITGGNGTGKSNLYRALRLLVAASQNRIVGELAREGGLPAAMFAGPDSLSVDERVPGALVQGKHSQGPSLLQVGFASESLGYSAELGYPIPGATKFSLDPVLKSERVFHGPLPKPAAVLVERSASMIRSRGPRNAWRVIGKHLDAHNSLFGHPIDPNDAPELAGLRESMRGWRFYDSFRCDSGAPLRQPQIGTRTTALHHSGEDLAPAIQTILEIGDDALFDELVDDAFPGARVRVQAEGGRFSLLMEQPGLLRPLGAAELSDGTLRYLCLLAALLSPRPAPLLVLNEPESSLHGDLLMPLASLIGAAARVAQVVVVSHAPPLVRALSLQSDCLCHELERSQGRTVLRGQGVLDTPPWHWASP